MPTLVHIADERNSSSILRSGIRPDKYRGVVYCMPIIQSHFISHQWVRELRRSGANVLVGVYFRLPDEEIVWAGRYNQPHEQLRLGEAIQQLNALVDPLGFELFLNRKIRPREIQKIRHLPQGIGWRYKPHAHGQRPCPCPYCTKGTINSKRLRDRLDPELKALTFPEIKAQLASAAGTDDIIENLWLLRSRRRTADPSFLEPLLSNPDHQVLEDLAGALAYFRHPTSRRMLLQLREHPEASVAEVARESLRGLS